MDLPRTHALFHSAHHTIAADCAQDAVDRTLTED